ncbi:glycine/betaine ABC transporter ATP-binding protein [Suicoccus acidiformans]|uniref:ABC-type quaternary amine transporter n=1 Tax=Suicoccus acidiformans TaxID=2036206 RepID=A0A347WKU3_9LACT|nr:ABC transporter ATP-binding protein [Suicoccus acidiformans]AXY25700.1 glycine/betaine ABC transporter ATP-binding protein [Suicoccus acidiformans]
MIEVKGVAKEFAGQVVLEAIDLQIADNEFFVLVGPSGSGKTTLLKLLNRLEDPDGGQILIDGQDTQAMDLRDLRLEMGYVLQKIALFPNLTVLENIELIPEMKGMAKDVRRQKARDWLDRVGMAADVYADRYPRELSGGEQQRVGILRALIGEPKVLLMDEPFSALDPITRRQLQDEMRDLQEKLDLTIVFVTHQMSEALYLGGRICIIKDGRVQQVDTPEGIQAQPANDFVAEFFEKRGDANGSFTDNL